MLMCSVWCSRVLFLYFFLYNVWGFNIHNHFPDTVIQNNTELFHELSRYIHYHSRDAITNNVENLCSRRFAVGTYSAPEQIGNHMHEFLNGFLAAFVTNRTLLWQYCDRRPCRQNPYAKCNEMLPRLPWMMQIGELWQLWKERNCTEHPGIHVLTNIYQRETAEEIALCCGMDNLPMPVIYFGTFEQHEYYSMHLPQARLFDESKRRAQLLFRSGEHFGYGVLLKSSFHISKQIVEDNNLLILKHILRIQLNSSHPQHVISMTMQSEHDPFFISLHIRHAHTAPQSRIVQDNRGLGCLMKLVTKYQDTIMKGRMCILLLSTDRAETLEYYSSLPFESLGNCSLLTTNHDGNHIQRSEHGPYSGELAVRDVELLSRGDLLIGSIYNTAKLSLWTSSFSNLIGEFRAMNGRPYSLEIPPIFTATCEGIVGSRIEPKEIFTNVSKTCTANNMQGITLPAECPYQFL